MGQLKSNKAPGNAKWVDPVDEVDVFGRKMIDVNLWVSGNISVM